MFKTKIAAAVALACLSSVALAQSKPADSGWYIGASVGGSSTDVSDSDLASSATYLGTLGVTGITYSKSETDTGYKLFLGYQFNPNFGLEGGYANLGEFDAKFNGTYLGVPGTITAKADVDAWFLDVVGTAPLSREFSIFGKIGYNSVRADATGTVSWAGFTNSISESNTNSGVHFGVGATYAFTPQVVGRLEWERFTGVKATSQGSDKDVDLWSVGLQVRF
jgi:OOP family OmpA-OmpF porin